MNYSQFIIKVKEGLQERLGAEVKVEAIHVPKNNGVVLQGITVRRPEEKVVPTIYMERFYEDYLEGRDMDDILEEFMEIYEEQETAQMPDFAFYQDYEKVKRRLALKLVNRKKMRRCSRRCRAGTFWIWQLPFTALWTVRRQERRQY